MDVDGARTTLLLLGIYIYIQKYVHIQFIMRSNNRELVLFFYFSIHLRHIDTLSCTAEATNRTDLSQVMRWNDVWRCDNETKKIKLNGRVSV